MRLATRGIEVVHLRHSRLLVIVVLCGTLPSLASGLSGALGDAGTGSDAGNTRDAALSLAYGAYDGNLTPQDADWFAFSGASTLGCLDVTGTASTSMRFEVATNTSTVGGLANEGVFQLTLASTGPSFFAVLPDEAPWSTLSVGPYSFSVVHAEPWAMGDRRGADAPGNASLASPAPAECFSASFRHDAPDIDAWTFEASALDIVTYSFAVDATAIGVLEILGPDGTTVAGPVASGEAGQFIATSTGTYAVRTASFASSENTDYVVGLVVGPDPSTCRPYCLALG